MQTCLNLDFHYQESYDHISGKFLSYDKEVQPTFLTFNLYIYSMLTLSSGNIVFNRKSSFHPIRKRVGFAPQFITDIADLTNQIIL